VLHSGRARGPVHPEAGLRSFPLRCARATRSFPLVFNGFRTGAFTMAGVAAPSQAAKDLFAIAVVAVSCGRARHRATAPPCRPAPAPPRRALPRRIARAAPDAAGAPRAAGIALVLTDLGFLASFAGPRFPTHPP